jgi:hypothetical protein
MLFGYLTLFTALIISLSAAVYSILGLTAIFAAAFWPIVIMGGSLEVGKIVTTLWLHKYWARAEIQYKLYLCSAVVILMLLTSMGVFGFLSKAHSDQSLVSGDVGAKIAIYDEKIKISRENIDANRKALKQMDEAVDQVMARSSDEKGADKAVAIRRGQQKERGRLLAEIEAEQKKITSLNEERAPIAAENRKVEAEVGPIKYIAALVYGDNPDANVLERAVRWVIILIVVVFDPLALTLLLAATKALEWEKGVNIFAPKKKDDEESDYTDEPVFDRETEIPLEEHIPDPEPEEELPVVEKKPRWAGFGFPMSGIFNKSKEEPVVEEPAPVEVVAPAVVEEAPVVITTIGDDYVEVNGKRMHHKAFDPRSEHAAHAVERHIEKTQQESAPPSGDGNLWVNQDNGWVNAGPVNQYDLGLSADNAPNALTGEMRGFGTSFPTAANKGDMFLRVDQLPSRLYKFNGNIWIEIDKELSDQHAYDEAYIDHLIEKISTGEYDPELLSSAERDSIEQRLKNNPRQV